MQTHTSAKAHPVSIHKLTVAAVLSTIAFVLMQLEFPIPALMPSFIKMDLSDLPPLLGAFAVGPVWGVVIELTKNLLDLLIAGTTTSGVGELCNFLLGGVFVFTAGLVYQHKKTRWMALLGAFLGALAMALLSVPINYWVTYPTYALFMPIEEIIGAYQKLLPAADSLLKCLLIFNLPFTFVKGMLDVLLCWLIYKPLSPVLHGRR